MKPFLEVADTIDGTFAVLSIDPTSRVQDGCIGLVQSVHRGRGDAEAAIAKARGAE